MFIYRIINTPFSGAVDKRLAQPGPVASDRVVVFSDTLTIDSHGACAMIYDHKARQTKYLIIGEPRCHVCGNCARRPLLVNTIHVTDPATEVELKSHNLHVSEQAKAYCSAHGIRLTSPPGGPAPAVRDSVVGPGNAQETALLEMVEEDI